MPFLVDEKVQCITTGESKEFETSENGFITARVITTMVCSFGIVKEQYEDGSFDVMICTPIWPPSEEGTIWMHGETCRITEPEKWELYDEENCPIVKFRNSSLLIE